MEKSIAEEMRVECQEKIQLSFRINSSDIVVLVHVTELLFTCAANITTTVLQILCH